LTLIFTKFDSSQKGKALIELALALPLLLLLVLGVVELSNMLNSYLVLTHLTREGANSTSRGTDSTIDSDLDAVIAAADPIIRSDNPGQWKVIYSQIGPGETPESYQVSRMDSWIRGGFGKESKIGFDGSPVNWAELGVLPSSISAGNRFHVVEVYYDYRPSLMTPLENFLRSSLPTTFYERAIFTDVTRPTG